MGGDSTTRNRPVFASFPQNVEDSGRLFEEAEGRAGGGGGRNVCVYEWDFRA